MLIKMKELSIKKQKELRAILRGNGLTAHKVNLYNNGNKIGIELKATREIIAVIYFDGF
jgi:hypothetical protein